MKIKKNSIAFLCQFFYPEKVSSATLPFDTAKYFAEKKYDVFCLCGYPKEYLNGESKPKKNDIVDGVKIKRLNYLTLSRKSFIGRLVNYFSFTFKCMLNKRYFKGYEYLVVYSNPPILPYVAYKIFKKYKTKIIFVSYDVYPEIAINTYSISKNGFIAKIMNKINKRIFSSAYRIVALSDDMKDFLIKNRNVSEANVKVIPNWFELSESIKKEKESTITVTYLGNLGVCQDIDTILKCALLLKNDSSIRFILGGHGSKMEYIKKYVADNDLQNIEVYPFLTGEKYREVMSKSDAFIVSLEKRLKGLCFPSKYYSYLAYGRPIIAITENCSLSDEILKEKIGFHIQNGQTEKMVEILMFLKVINKYDYNKICFYSRNLYEIKYTKEKCLENYLKNIIEND